MRGLIGTENSNAMCLDFILKYGGDVLKKVTTLLLLIASVLSFYIVYGNERNIYSNRIEQIEINLENSYEIMIPVSIDNKDKTQTYEIIKNTLDKYKGNIYYDRISKDETTKIKYIYDRSNMYLPNINVMNGNKLTPDNMESNKYLSTKRRKDEQQIGRIATFNKYINREIRTLKSMVSDEFNFSGSCYVAFENELNINDFISDLNGSLGIQGIFLIDKMPMGINQNEGYKIIVIIIYFIVMILILYELLNSYKKIGVKKLLGYSNKDIYFENTLNLTKINLSIGIITTIVMSFIFFNQLNTYVYSFIFKFMILILVQTLVLIAICSIAYLYIFFVKISDMLKNRKPLTGIIILNYIAKLVCLTAMTFFIVQAIDNSTNIKNLFNKNYKNWEALDGFAIIPISNIPISILLDREYYENTYVKIQKEMYKEFNEKGAIYANFNEFSPGVRAMRLSETNNYFESDNVYVNPNYLKEYKVYDSEDNEISISEDDEDQIILIPEKYKYDEENLKKHADYWKEQNFVSIGPNQKTRIIWTKSNQKVFTASIDINPDDGNEIIDPIINVLTENNASDSDYDFMQAVMGNPFKIKAAKGMSVEDTINGVFSKYDMKKYLGTIAPVNEQVASSIKNLKDSVKNSIIFTWLLIIVLLAIIIQNSINYIDKYKIKLAIEKLTGYKMIHKHKNYLLGIVACWFIVFTLSIIIYKSDILVITAITTVGFFIEVLISLVILNTIEKRKIIKIIKGE